VGVPPAAELSSAERRRLRARAHPLAPVAQVGRQGLSDAFLAEVDRALESHELIKLRLHGERDERAAQLAAVSERLGAAVVGAVGGVAILFRKAEQGASAGADAAEAP
jgi:RNA-binding protein